MNSYRRRGSDGENRNRLKGSENAIKEGCDALYNHIIPYIMPRERHQEISGGILLKNIVGVCRLPECSQRRAVSLFLNPSAPPSCILMLFILTSKLTTANYPSDMCALLSPQPPLCVCVLQMAVRCQRAAPHRERMCSFRLQSVLSCLQSQQTAQGFTDRSEWGCIFSACIRGFRQIQTVVCYKAERFSGRSMQTTFSDLPPVFRSPRLPLA